MRLNFPILCLPLVGVLACAGPRPAEGDDELSVDEFRELLDDGTITPVSEMGEDPFAGVDPSMEDPYVDPEVLAQVIDPVELAADLRPQEPPRENPYLVFGERIRVNPDGTITKPFPLRVGTGKRMEDLIRAYGNFPLWDGGEVPSGPEQLKMETLERWDVELYMNLRDPNPAAQPVEVALADWLVVTTGFSLLQDVENFINLFGAGVPQIEIEAKIVEISFTDTLDVGVSTSFDFPSHTFIDGFDTSTPNIADAGEALLTMGGVLDGTIFSATLEAVATLDNVSIISRPKIAVREGGRADISNTRKLPILDITGINNGGGFNAKVSYQEVGTRLFVVPRVVGTETVALTIDIEASQQTGSEPVLAANTSEGSELVTVPVLSLRTAHTTVYLQPGQAVILGGLINERSVEQERRVPILADIPLVGMLFRSKFTRKEQTNVLFFIRPRILQGSDMNREF
jgi:type II secretory pathway component GspD/PulD (secretin)